MKLYQITNAVEHSPWAIISLIIFTKILGDYTKGFIWYFINDLGCPEKQILTESTVIVIVIVIV